MNNKQTYYRLEKLNDTIPAHYHILLGERSNGKSYAVKERALLHAWNDPNDKFILLRRWGIEIKASYVEQYFVDAPITAITNNECNTVVCNGGKIFLAKFEPDTQKTIRVKHVGYYRDLCGEQHFVSQNFDDVSMVIFEEFISRDYYLPNESTKLQNFISTVARRRVVPVYMIGNTISRVCPYFVDFNLSGVPKQKQGTIQLYEIHTGEYDDDKNEIIVRVTVEYCENSGKNSKMFFGKPAKMITSGAWQVKDYPHLPRKLREYSILHELIFIHTGFKFKMFFVQAPDETALPFWYIEPFTDNVYNNDRFKSTRFVVHTFSESLNIQSDMVTIGFKPLTETERFTFTFLERFVVSDNLTGSDFETCFKSINH